MSQTHAPQATWWPAALSEEVTADKPLGVLLAGEAVALFRDSEGVVRALEDRCPHRRAPLSLGRMRNGALQCGYHGWTFEGQGGACIAIPNLNADERVPPRYKAETYAVAERHGFVLVRTGAADAPAAEPALPHGDVSFERSFQGSTVVSLDHAEYLAALLDGPDLLFEVPGLMITDYIFRDVADSAGLRAERGVVFRNRWSTPHPVQQIAHVLMGNHAFVTEYPFILTTTVSRPTGLTSVDLRTETEEPVLLATLAPAPAARGATAVRWRGGLVAGATSRLARQGRRLAADGLKVFDHVDGRRLSTLLAGPSLRWDETQDGAAGTHAPQAA